MPENPAMSVVCLPFDAEGKGLLHICLTFKADLIYENIALPLPPFSVQLAMSGWRRRRRLGLGAQTRRQRSSCSSALVG